MKDIVEVLNKMQRATEKQDKGFWAIYIPEEGHWKIDVPQNATKAQAREAYLKWANRKRLPANSIIQKNI